MKSNLQKKLFKIEGKMMWIDKFDQKNFLEIKEFVWAPNEKRAESLIRLRVAIMIKKHRKLSYFPRVFFWDHKISQIPLGKNGKQLKLLFPNEKQLKLPFLLKK